MNYANLTKTKARAVDAFVLKDPSLRTANTITRKQVEELFHEIRKTDPKFGYPSWIEKGTKVARGLYVFPGPDADMSNSPDLTTAKSAADSEFAKEFEQEMSESGII